jgi:hypothetical protein
VLERGSSQGADLGARTDASADSPHAGAGRSGAAVAQPKRQKRSAAGARQRPGSRARDRGLAATGSRRDRPRAPWHPLPLSELLILVGAIGAAIGFSRGVSHGAAPMFAGLAAVLIGTLEFTLREHLSGYRSHAILIAVLGVAVFHSAVALSVAAFTNVPRTLNVALIAVDVALFAVLFKLLRSRFLDARRERVFAGGR